MFFYRGYKHHVGLGIENWFLTPSGQGAAVVNKICREMQLVAHISV